MGNELAVMEEDGLEGTSMEEIFGWIMGAGGAGGGLWGLWKVRGAVVGVVAPLVRGLIRNYVQDDPRHGNGSMRDTLKDVHAIAASTHGMATTILKEQEGMRGDHRQLRTKHEALAEKVETLADKVDGLAAEVAARLVDEAAKVLADDPNVRLSDLAVPPPQRPLRVAVSNALLREPKEPAE